MSKRLSSCGEKDREERSAWRGGRSCVSSPCHDTPGGSQKRNTPRTPHLTVRSREKQKELRKKKRGKKGREKNVPLSLNISASVCISISRMRRKRKKMSLLRRLAWHSLSLSLRPPQRREREIEMTSTPSASSHYTLRCSLLFVPLDWRPWSLSSTAPKMISGMSVWCAL